jgi:hypothetical protein
MRNNLRIGCGCFIAAIILFASCHQDIQEKSNERGYIPVRELIPLDSLQNNASRAIWHQINAVENALTAIERHVDIPENTRSVSGSFDWQQINSLLPDDLSTLRRPAEGRASVGDEISLQEELDEIVMLFNEAMIPLVPCLEGIKLIGGITADDTLIYLSDDELVGRFTLEGIALAEVLIAIAGGEEPEAAAARISAEIEAAFGDDEAMRGLYVRPIMLWSNGVVNYSFSSNMHQTLRDAVRTGMATWQTAVGGGRIRFQEFNASALNNVLVILGITHVLSIEQRNQGTMSGQALPGSAPWGIAYMRLDIGLTSDPTVMRRVVLHELGHVLGLQHEHQRWDRDQFVDISNSMLINDPVNMARIPEVTLNLPRIEWRSRRIAFVTIRYPVIVIRAEAQFVKTAWDFHSIMLYRDLVIRPNHANATNGNRVGTSNTFVTRINNSLSTRDIEIIRRLY